MISARTMNARPTQARPNASTWRRASTDRVSSSIDADDKWRMSGCRSPSCDARDPGPAAATCLPRLRPGGPRPVRRVRADGWPAGAMSHRACPSGLPWPLPAGLVQLEWCAAFTGPGAGGHPRPQVPRRATARGAPGSRRWQTAGGGRAPAGDLVVHVPVHASKLRSVASTRHATCRSRAPRALGLPAVHALERAERTAAMHDLGRAERARNVGGAFRVRPGLGAPGGGPPGAARG